MLVSSARPVSGLNRGADRVLHERVRDDDEVRRDVDGDRHDPEWSRGARVSAAGSSRRSTGRGTWIPGRTPRSLQAPSGAPKTSPMKIEYSLQFIPNWNSCTIPVATPIAKLIRNSLPKNRVSRYQAVVVGDDPGCLHHGDERGESDGQRDEEEVVDGRDAELPPRHIKCIHWHHLPEHRTLHLRRSVVDP